MIRRQRKLTDLEIRLLVTEAAVFGLRHAARTFGIVPSAAHYWIHHEDYRSIYARAKERVELLAGELRSELWRAAA